MAMQKRSIGSLEIAQRASNYFFEFKSFPAACAIIPACDGNVTYFKSYKGHRVVFQGSNDHFALTIFYLFVVFVKQFYMIKPWETVQAILLMTFAAYDCNLS